MQTAHAPLPRGRSPFVAAFLSLLFPGLGHAYLGAYRRGLGFAAPPLLLGALLAGIAVRLDPAALVGVVLASWFTTAVFIANLLLMAYRAFAIVDAWAVARAMSGRPMRGVAPSAARAARTVSLAGLGAVLLVMSVAHVAVARYDLLLESTAHCIFEPGATDCDPAATPGPSGETPGPDETSAPTGTPEPTVGPAVSAPAEAPWDGKSRLSILLIGADEQGGGHNTDTLITVSIDPASGRVAMFTLPRDTVDVPIPPGPARQFFGSVYSGKINSFFARVRNRADLFPGTSARRGYNGLKAVLGHLYGLDIKYFVEVNFDGFTRTIDALGGVTVNVQVPILDDNYPRAGGHRERLYIPAGIQHMTGGEALDYARSRKSTTDFDRGARQQRVLLSLRQQVDIARILPSIDTLAAALRQSIRTDIPRELVPKLLEVAQGLDTHAIRSLIFTPPYYQQEFLNSPRGYIIVPRVARIRDAVAQVFAVDPAFTATREALAGEGAQVWVLNGSGEEGAAARVSDYLSYLGMAASAPNQKPDTTGLSATRIRAYNGAEADFPLTLAALEQVFGVTVEPVADPAVRVDFIIVTAKSTPDLTPPPLP